MSNQHSNDNYNDAEKNLPTPNTPTPTSSDSSFPRDTVGMKEPWTRRFVDSFKRGPNAHVSQPSQAANLSTGEGNHATFDHKGAAEATANSGLAHKLKARHMQMIAIGGSIGKLNIATLPEVETNVR